ncbi:hypothetical protein [Actinoplanes sp. NPDC051859]|uniref:hypothetical protein n=1 Tax=Actinoplanes sp. NPDC051859 TaxID=3363909 RepID=UPI0037A86D7B
MTFAQAEEPGDHILCGRPTGVWRFRADAVQGRDQLGVRWFDQAMRNLRVRHWLPVSVLTGMSTVLVYLYGFFSLAWDIFEDCQRHNQPFDQAYRSEHPQEPGRWFPLHDKCNANFDLVPAWVNPAVVTLATATVISLIITVVAGGAKIGRSRTRVGATYPG